MVRQRSAKPRFPSSNLGATSKKEAPAKQVLLFWPPAANAASALRRFKMLGRNEFALREGFGLWPKRFYGRRRPALRVPNPELSISLLLLYKSKPLCRGSICFSASFFFGLRRLMPPPPFGDLKAHSEMNFLCAEVFAWQKRSNGRRRPALRVPISERAHFAAPPLQIETALLGFDLF